MSKKAKNTGNSRRSGSGGNSRKSSSGANSRRSRAHLIERELTPNSVLFNREHCEKHGRNYEVSYMHSGKSEYLCPGCLKNICIGESSVTIIEQDHIFGWEAAVNDRRHWHKPCWDNF